MCYPLNELKELVAYTGAIVMIVAVGLISYYALIWRGR